MRFHHLVFFLLICLLYLTTGSAHARAKHVSYAEPITTLATSDLRPSGTESAGNIGLGFLLGEPTGLSLKSWTSSHTAIDVGLTYSFSNYFEVLGDYLWHFPYAFARAGRVASEFVPYVGLGGEILFDTRDNGSTYRDTTSSNAAFGVRVPLGIEFLPHRAPLGAFAELAPGLALAPGVFGFVEGDVGARYYF